MKHRSALPVWALFTALTTAAGSAAAATFGEDAAFLSKHIGLIILSDPAHRAKVGVVPAWQGRVMTSTSSGDAGPSYGWINRELIAAGKPQPHINVFGGEDRFWLGPEGGQFSIFFAKGAPFELKDWFTPPALDTLPFRLVNRARHWARLAAEFGLTNHTGRQFTVKVDREVRLLDSTNAWAKLGLKPVKDLTLVAYESENKITNAGQDAWVKETGLLSIWILGMFNPSPATTIVVPIQPGPDAELGVKVTSDYFGAVPPTRLVVKENVVYFSGDGGFRSKIGINPKRSRAVLGSYAADQRVLTLVQFSQPAGVTDYVNSLWKLQDNPYGGDAANSYNDGPPAPDAKALGPFYELESSSPAASLAPGQSLTHLHRTTHLSGPEPALDAVARAVLGVSLAEIKSALKP